MMGPSQLRAAIWFKDAKYRMGGDSRTTSKNWLVNPPVWPRESTTVRSN